MVTQGAVTVVGKAALALVEPLVNGKIVLHLPAVLASRGLGMVKGMGHGFIIYSIG